MSCSIPGHLVCLKTVHRDRFARQREIWSGLVHLSERNLEHHDRQSQHHLEGGRHYSL